MGFIWFSLSVGIIFLISINQMIFVMEKCGVLFEVRTEFLNIINISFGFKGL
jgi:cytochrome bd-type quinol oxidase subunit 1